MSQELEYSLPPAIRRIATAFLRWGRISLWVQGILGIISGAILIFAVGTAGQSANGTSNIGIGLVISGIGLIAVYLGAFWAFRYTRLARSLRSRDESRRPKPKDVLRLLKIGLFISLGGMLFTLLGTEATIGLLIGELANPSTSGVGGLGTSIANLQIITLSDMFMIQAKVNIVLAHFLGLVFTLWILNNIDRT